MPLYFEDVFNDGMQTTGVVFRKPIFVGGNTTGTGAGVYFGTGAPTISAPQGSLYLRSDGSSVSTRLYVNTNGSTTWTNVTTAA